MNSLNKHYDIRTTKGINNRKHKKWKNYYQ